MGATTSLQCKFVLNTPLQSVAKARPHSHFPIDFPTQGAR